MKKWRFETKNMHAYVCIYMLSPKNHVQQLANIHGKLSVRFCCTCPACPNKRGAASAAKPQNCTGGNANTLHKRADGK